ncbi:hypothetical protein psal_cds_917 [Pandoravirus salinus]|uniref:Uncharacterized protein n=1 Tax=Pandoravirus salinus TaxID=1349410 RepID=S4W379_9VIRU|nr:hypothetical protein psal_cds_917 [Pandoravirus salinus]AGO85037.1 hypothetical protein psal_cds_917 [Pandoravirus salinus]
MAARGNSTTAVWTVIAGALLALVLIAMPADAALGDPIYPGTLVRIYAVGPGEWVRRSATHSTSPVRAADNISESQATLFLLEGGPPGAVIPLPSTTINLIDAFTVNPYCEPRNGVSGWSDTTIMCRDTSDGDWLLLIAAPSSGPNTVLNSGDEVYIYNTRNDKFCVAPTWPSNNAGLYCSFFTISTLPAAARFKIYSA